MTSLFPSGKTPQAVALAFAVASLQNQSGVVGGLTPIPQALLEAATTAGVVAGNPSVSFDSDEKPDVTARGAQQSQEPADYDVDDEPQGGGGGGEDEDDNERRLARSRERNREHARRTRLRKKAQLESLQSKVKGLEAERQVLKQKVEECGIASILLGLSAGEQENPSKDTQETTAATSNNAGSASAPDASSSDNNNNKNNNNNNKNNKNNNENKNNADDESQSRPTAMTDSMVAALSGAKRKRFISEAIGEQPNQQRLTINVDGHVTVIGAGKSHINWKTGVYRDQQGVQRQLTSEQLEDLRRERNRMHAKMTRSRKKCFISTIEKAIEELEAENRRMREILEKVACTSLPVPSPTPPTSRSPQPVITPVASPGLAPSPGPSLQESFNSDEDSSVYSEQVNQQHPKRHKTNARHGFLLDG